MSGIVFETPPTVRRGRVADDSATRAIAQALIEREGEWAKIAEGSKDSSLVSRIKQGKHAAWEPAGAFEATSRRSDDGEITVWARYVGLNGSQPDHDDWEDEPDDELDDED